LSTTLPFATMKAEGPARALDLDGVPTGGRCPFPNTGRQHQFDALSLLLSAQGRGFALDRFWSSRFLFAPGRHVGDAGRGKYGFEFAFISRNGHLLWRKIEGSRGGSSHNAVWTPRPRDDPRRPSSLHPYPVLDPASGARARDALRRPPAPSPAVRPPLGVLRRVGQWLGQSAGPRGGPPVLPPGGRVANLRATLEDEEMAEVQLSANGRELRAGGPDEGTPIGAVLDRPGPREPVLKKEVALRVVERTPGGVIVEREAFQPWSHAIDQIVDVVQRDDESASDDGLSATTAAAS